jgi:hypothetical protein
VAEPSRPTAAATGAASAPATVATPAGTGTAVALSPQDAEFERIAGETSSLRELPIKAPVKESYLSREQLRQRLERDQATEYPPAEAEAEERVLKAFGLVPEGFDLRSFVLDLYTEQIAGFYDPKTDEMYVISKQRNLDPTGELTYAHEVTHALQDQHYDLERIRAPYKDKNDDALLSVTALIEGDASLLSENYLLEHPDLVRALRESLLNPESTDGSQRLADAPPILSRTLIFPYQQGKVFATTLWRDGGWEAVNEAYQDPPISTEQVLHPEEKYVERDDPTSVRLPDLTRALGPGWKRIDENLLGELQTGILLEGDGSEELVAQAEEAAAGWDGDRYALWANGLQEVLVWRSVWDSPEDASQFAAGLRAREERRLNAPFQDQGGRLTLSQTGKVTTLVQSGNEVAYVQAPTPTLADAAIAALHR